jgi:hypothetical protein
MERSVIVSQLERHPRDPFMHVPLAISELIPQPDLQRRIQEWNAKRKDGSRTSECGNLRCASIHFPRKNVVYRVVEDVIAVSAHALGQLVSEDGGDLPPEVMQALIDAEKLNAAAKHAEQVAHDAEAASRHRPKRRWATDRGAWDIALKASSDMDWNVCPPDASRSDGQTGSDEDFDVSLEGGEELPRMIDVEELEDVENDPTRFQPSRATSCNGSAGSTEMSSRHKEHARILAIQHRWDLLCSPAAIEFLTWHNPVVSGVQSSSRVRSRNWNAPFSLWQGI